MADGFVILSSFGRLGRLNETFTASLNYPAKLLPGGELMKLIAIVIFIIGVDSSLVKQ
jgi:hypothetical protein